jgi:hypothetical protein
MLVHRFHGLVFVGAQSDASSIRKHEPLMGPNFLDYVFGHFDAQAVSGPSGGLNSSRDSFQADFVAGENASSKPGV